MNGQGIQSEITVALRAENLTDEPLTVSMYHYLPNGEEHWEHFVEWQGEGWGTFTLEPHAALDFGVLLRPFPEEAEDQVVQRWLRALSLDEEEVYAELDVNILLDDYLGLTIEGTPVEADEDFGAILKAVNHTPATLENVRFLGQLMGPDGHFLGALETEPYNGTINALGSANAELLLMLTDEERALGELTVIMWAYAEYPQGDEGARIPVLSTNTWQYTLNKGGATEPEPTPADMTVSLALSEGDRLYKAGEPIPLDFEIYSAGDHALENLQVWLEPVETGTDSFIYEDFGDLMIDTSFFAEDGFVPGAIKEATHYHELTLPLGAARLGGFDMKLIAEAYDPAIDDIIQRTARVHLRTVDNDAGLVLIVEPDTVRYTLGKSIYFKFGVRNEGDTPIEDMGFYCRSGTEAEANNESYVEVVMHADEPLQPGETLWREEPFRCLPIDTLQGGDLHVRFTVVGWAGREHVTTERRFVFLPVRQAVLELTGEPDVEAFAPGERFNYPVTVKNTGNAPIEDCVVLSQAIPADAEGSQVEFPLFKDGEALWPSGKKDLPWYYDPDGFEGESITLRIAVSGRNADTGEPVSAEWTRTIPRAGTGSESEGPLTLKCVLDEKSYEEGETAYVNVIARNDGDKPLARIDLRVFISHPENPMEEFTGEFVGHITDGLAPGEETTAIYEYQVTKEDAAYGRVHLEFWAVSATAEDWEPQEAWTTQEVNTGSTIMYALYTGLGGGSAEDAALAISSSASADGYEEGDKLTFHVDIENTGERTLNQLAVKALLLDESSSTLVDADIASWPNWPFDPDGTLSFDWDYILSQGDVARGFVRATFFAFGLDAETHDPVSAACSLAMYLSPFSAGEDEEEKEDGDGTPLTITKSVVGHSEYTEGYHLFEYINYAITVTNNSPDGVGLTVYDECAGSTPDLLGTVWLPPEESKTFNYAFEVGKFEVMDGEVVNEAYAVVNQITEGSTAFGVGETYWADPVTVKTTYRQPDPVDRPDEYRVEVTKKALGKPKNGNDYQLGEEVWYEITVANPTNNTINSALIFDELIGYADQPEYLGTIALGFGQSMSLTYRHVVTEEDVAAGRIDNRAYALLALINQEGDVEDVSFQSDVVTVTTTDAPPETMTSEHLIPPECVTPPEPPRRETKGGAAEETFCRRRLTGLGAGVREYERVICGEHQPALEAFANALTAADADAPSAWEAAVASLKAAVNEAYDQLRDLMADEAGKALVDADRDSFFAQLDTLRTMLAPATDAAAAKAVAEQLLDRMIDLCAACHDAPQTWFGDLAGGKIKALTAGQPLPERCQIAAETAAKDVLNGIETLCPNHAAIEQRLIPLLSVSKRGSEISECFRLARREWEAALRAIGRHGCLQGGVTPESVSADLIAFNGWLNAREALLKRLWPGDEPAITELLADAARRRATSMDAATTQP